MKAKIVVLLISLSLVFTSCATLKTKTTKTMDIYGDGVIQMPIIVDLNVSEVKAETKISSQSLSIDDLKNEAVADLLKKADADVLIEPKFEVVINGSMNTVTVSGFPASYSNFRQIQLSDVELLNVGIAQKAKTHEPAPAPTKKKKTGKGFAIGASILAGAALFVLIVLTS
ncbi:MAG: hypothetical protein KGZ82_11235 [Bacteroidales bacterium]|nr:hypothetical protein [Bacteroidales bacterium]